MQKAFRAFQSSQVFQLWWDGKVILEDIPGSSDTAGLFVFPSKPLHFPPFSVRDDNNGRKQELACLQLRGECWACSLHFSPSFFAQPGLKSAATFSMLRRKDERKIILPAPLMSGKLRKCYTVTCSGLRKKSQIWGTGSVLGVLCAGSIQPSQKGIPLSSNKKKGAKMRPAKTIFNLFFTF